MAQADRRTYHTLDGMRGVAALFVVARHTGYAFHPLYSPNSFIAVDLFFVLSGFVIAAAYDRRLGSGELTPWRFFVLRYIRLWPLYLLATLLGLGILYSQIRHGKSSLDLATFGAVAPLSVLMIPSVLTRGFYPASMVAWTLFYEMLINVAYALAFRWLGTRTLVAVVAVAGAGIVAACLSRFSLDNGWSWGTSWIGLARVGYSFPLGILLYRHHDRLPKLKLPAWAVLVLLAVLLGITVPAPLRAPWLMLTVLALLPLLVAAAVDSEPPQRWIRVFNALGATSYAIYVLHPPLLTCIDWFCDKMGIHYGPYSPASGVIILGIVFAGAWFADRYYDQPARRWLTRTVNRAGIVAKPSAQNR